MDSVHIWYLTDNSEGKENAGKIRQIGLDVKVLSGKNTQKEIINTDDIYIFIFDYINFDISKVISVIQKDQRIYDFQKFIFVQKRKFKEAMNTAVNFSHAEFLVRPVNENEFLLLLEKTVIIERYREVMKNIAKEAESRIGNYENLMDINRKDLFVSDAENKNFKNIVNFEKNLIKKQIELNKSIREYSFLRQRDMFYDENRIKAEVRLNELGIQDLNKVINTLNFPENSENFHLSKFIESNNNAIAENKSGHTDSEYGRMRKELADLKERNKQHLSRINELKQEINELKTRKKKTVS